MATKFINAPLGHLLDMRETLNEMIGKYDGALEFVPPAGYNDSLAKELSLDLSAAPINQDSDKAEVIRNAEQAVSAAAPAITIAPKDALRFIPWGNTVPSAFLEGVLWIEGQIGLNAAFLMPCMKFESGINPQARNPQSSATGLIQFMRATAIRLGTTVEKLYAMDAVTQLSYVYKYFKDYDARGFRLETWTLADTYMAILWPAAIGKSDSYQVFAGGTNAYNVNRGLDLNKDGFVSKAEAAAKVTKLFEEGMSERNRKAIPTVLAA